MSTTTQDSGNVSRETDTDSGNVSRETDTDSGNVSRETDTSKTSSTNEKTTNTEPPAAAKTDDTDSGDNENSSSDIGKVRKEAAGYRTKLRDTEKERDELREQLFRSKVAASGKLADAEDMPVNSELLADDDALQAAIDELIERKPHLKARSFGDIGLGEKKKTEGVSLGSILRNNA